MIINDWKFKIVLLTVLLVIFGVVTLGRPISISAQLFCTDDCYSMSGWFCSDDTHETFFPSGETNSCLPGACYDSGCLCYDICSNQCLWTGGGCSATPVSCFLPGTKIATTRGEKEVEKIKSGEIIQSFDQETREITSSVVSELYSVTRDHYYVVKTESGEEVKTTDEHPFYTGKESPPAKSLKEKIINFYSMVIIYFKDGLQTVKTSFRQ